jgi:hypothetical protein
MTLFLIGDVLDKQVVDARHTNAGRIDGIILSIEGDGAPRLTHVEVSPITMLARLNVRVAHWWARVDRRFGDARGTPFRIPWSRLRRTGPVFQLDVDVAATPINDVDRWLCEKVVERIPGS